MAVGVLALQGAITPHIRMIERLGIQAVRVTSISDLQKIDRIILPGGESTTMLKLLDREGLWDPLIQFCKKHPAWGTCAGAILLAKEVHNPSQKSFKVLDIAAERNAYGSQRESFKTELSVVGLTAPLAVDFIRAPKLTPLSQNIEVLARFDNHPVLMRHNHILVSSFHVELGEDTRLHEMFIKM